MFCYTLLYVHSSITIILMGKRELIALLNLSSWCLVMVERLFLAMPRGCLRFVIVVFPDHTVYGAQQTYIFYSQIQEYLILQCWPNESIFLNCKYITSFAFTPLTIDFNP